MFLLTKYRLLFADVNVLSELLFSMLPRTIGNVGASVIVVNPSCETLSNTLKYVDVERLCIELNVVDTSLSNPILNANLESFAPILFVSMISKPRELSIL